MPDPSNTPAEEADRILKNMECIMVIATPRFRIHAPVMKRITERKLIGTVIFEGVMDGRLTDSWWGEVIAEYFTAK